MAENLEQTFIKKGQEEFNGTHQEECADYDSEE